MTLGITLHALERFVERWRPGVQLDAARAELEVIVHGAGPTNRRTLGHRDAWIYVGTSAAGERVELAVRDSAVITVLPPESDRYHPKRAPDVVRDPELVADSADTVAACCAMLAQDARVQALVRARVNGAHGAALLQQTDEAVRGNPAARLEDRGAADRRISARQLLQQWKAGSKFKTKTLKKAHDTLGLPWEGQ